MCGIAGFIGNSKNPAVTNKLMTSIMSVLEMRGTDASGIWGVETAAQPRIIYHKAPIESSKFVNLPIWSKLNDFNPNLLICHARKTSPGVGGASFNKNNHPFVSEDRRIGLIHNGRINEATYLKNAYETQSDTDSEVLLRMYESSFDQKPLEMEGVPSYINERLSGLRDIWSVVHEGAMAVAVGEYHEDGSRSLIFFRNAKRPLIVVDLRERLGQIFFLSAVEVWHKALTKFERNSIGYNYTIAEVPESEIWSFKIDAENPIVVDDNFFRFGITKSKDEKNWVAGKKQEIPKPKMELEVVTDLKFSKEDDAKDDVDTTAVKWNESFRQGDSCGTGEYGMFGSNRCYANEYFKNKTQPTSSSGVTSNNGKKKLEDRGGKEWKGTFMELLDIEEPLDPLPEEESEKKSTETAEVEGDNFELTEPTGSSSSSIEDTDDLNLSDFQDIFDKDIDMSDFKKLAESLSDKIQKARLLLTRIEDILIERGLSGSLNREDVHTIVEFLENFQKEAEGTLHLINGQRAVGTTDAGDDLEDSA